MQRSVVPLATPSKFTHNDDYLVLEDESGRVKLTGGAISVSTYVTGTYRYPLFVPALINREHFIETIQGF